MNKKLALGMVAGATVIVASTALANPVKDWAKNLVGKQIAVVGWEGPHKGLHVRVTSPGVKTPLKNGKPYRVAGTVCAVDKKDENKISKLVRVKLEKEDKAEIGPLGHCVKLNFKLYGGVDGVTFWTKADALAFSFTVDEQPVLADKIYLGKDGEHPKGFPPFVLKR